MNKYYSIIISDNGEFVHGGIYERNGDTFENVKGKLSDDEITELMKHVLPAYELIVKEKENDKVKLSTISGSKEFIWYPNEDKLVKLT